MPKRCHFDPQEVHTSSPKEFSCPECGGTVLSGLPHMATWDEDIEVDHMRQEWIEEYREIEDDTERND